MKMTGANITLWLLLFVFAVLVVWLVKRRSYTIKKRRMSRESVDPSPAMSEHIDDTFLSPPKERKKAQASFDSKPNMRSSPMEMTPQEAEATALPFQKPVAVRQEDYRRKRYFDPIPETMNIDTECFGYFKGASVLIVEDNLINQKILLNVLKKAGIYVDVANNGQEAVNLIEEGRRYDLVIMDISMPVMDGIEATKRIRYKREYDNMPIVTFTAFNLGPEIKQMFEAGANAYLTKPLNIHQLYTVFSLFVGTPESEELPYERMLEIHGLDIRKGIENAEGDEEEYRKRLERFKHRYASTLALYEKWLERGDTERARLEVRDMYLDATSIGAYDLSYFLKELQKHFIYHNEHLVSRHTLMLKTKFQTLMDAIELYETHYKSMR